MKILHIFLIAQFLSFAALAESGLERLQAVNREVLSSQGAGFILRGVNVSGDGLVPPFSNYSPMDLKLVTDLGFNTVRLVFSWEQFEPTPGAYRESYFDWYVSILDEAAIRGLYVIIDVHQGLYSRFNAKGCGEGFPIWSIPPTVTTFPPDNGLACKYWFLNYFTDTGVHESFKFLYSPGSIANSRFVELWKVLATRLKGHPAVAGFELINEPFAARPNDELIPFYELLASVIRKADPSRMIVLEPQIYTTQGSFDLTQLRKPSFSNFILAPHTYPPVGVITKKTSPLDYTITHNALTNYENLSVRWNVPLLIGEFGLPATTVGKEAFVKFYYDEFDRMKVGSAQWNITPRWNPVTFDGWNTEDFSLVDGAGKLRGSFVPRPYVRRYSGRLVSMKVNYDPGQPHVIRSMQASVRHDPTKGPTIIYIPDALVSKAQVDVTGSSLASCQWVQMNSVSCLGSIAGSMEIVVKFQ